MYLCLGFCSNVKDNTPNGGEVTPLFPLCIYLLGEDWSAGNLDEVRAGAQCGRWRSWGEGPSSRKRPGVSLQHLQIESPQALRAGGRNAGLRRGVRSGFGPAICDKAKQLEPVSPCGMCSVPLNVVFKFKCL